MKKKVLFSLCLLATAGLQAQVGVNNADPQASLHITPQKTDGTTAEGIIAPNLTRAQLIGKDARYTAAQKGAIVYVTAVDGTATTKTAQITAIGYFYFDGTVWIPFRQPSTIIPTEPWQVQGSATAATGNTQNIYQTGSVAIGTGASAASGYKLDVNGTSNVSGNSRVGSSTVVGAQTVGTTLGVTGATTLASTLNVSGATTVASTGSFTLAGNGAAAGRYLASDVNGKGTWTALPAPTVTTANNGLAMSGTTTQLGGALTKATTISGTAANTLTVSAPSIISGPLQISSGTPAAGKFLTSDAAGNATWGTLPAPTVTTANNGLAMSGTTTQLGGALTKATTISGTAANTLTVSAPSIISGALRISSGTPGAGKYLASDAAGNATWGALPATATTEPWQVQGGAVAATTNAQNIYQTGSVGIGALTAVPAAYKLQVTGASYITGNSRVGSSTVVGNEQVSGNLGVTGTTGISGATTLGNTLTVAGATTLNGATTAKATTITGLMKYTNTVPVVGQYLRASAVDGSVGWATLPATATTEPWQVQGGAVAATTNAQNIYQTGSVGIGALTAVPAAYKLQVTGASNVTGNSRVGSSTVVGAQTVGSTLAVAGATTIGTTTTNANLGVHGGATITGATIIANTGSFTLAGNGAAANKYLASDANGKGTWTTLPATATTEPWQVQGGAVAATTNAQNIYQTGSIGIGASTAVPAAYKLQVTGASNVTGNSRVGSSTVVGAQTVGTTLGVTGATTLSSTLSVAGTSALRGATTVGTTTANANLTVYGNTGIGAAPQHKLHVAGNEYVSGISRIGGAATASTLFVSAQLELADNNKGFLPNRVALTGATVKAPVAYAVDGMMVYNTATVAAQDLKPGFYYWGANKWNRLVDEIPKTAVNIRNLVANVKSAGSTNAANPALGAAMDFGTITIPEDGAYAFTFRLYGNISPVPSTNIRAVYYIYLMANNVGKDAAEIDIHPPVATDMSYSVTLACEAKAGEVITFRLAHNGTASAIPVWTLKASNVNTNPVRTSMVWWKL